MAETAVLSSLLAVVFEKTASLFIDQLKGIWGSDIREELKKLQSILMTLQAVVEDAEERQLEDRPLRLWLAKLKGVAYNADDIVDEFHWEVLRQQSEFRPGMRTMVRHFFSSENCLLFRIRMGRRIREVVERFDDISAERSKFLLNQNCCAVNSWKLGSSSNRTETHSFVVESDVVGRREDMNKIVEMFITRENSESLLVLPIVGMGGLGKTTLAKMVYNEPRIHEHFQLQMWVCVPQDFDVAKLCKAIIESGTGNQFGGSLSMDSLQWNLKQMLGSKRYLLVLDDVWNEDATKWEDVKVLLSSGTRGSVVMTTTRSGVVSSIMGTIGPYELARLSQDECWALFKERAFARGREEDPKLIEIGKEIVKKFGGVPLAAKTVGSLMRLKNDETEWLAMLRSEIWDLPVGDGGILAVLRVSYNHLPWYLKQCFAFCSIFPKGHIMQNDVLIQLWMANGFVPRNKNMELEDKGQEIFNELVSRCFFQDVGELPYLTTKTCKMHDLFHDLARSVTRKECCILEAENLNSRSNLTMHHVTPSGSSTGRTIGEVITKSSNIRTLFSILHRSTPQSKHFWWKAKSLRALNLRNFSLKRIPSSICKLKHLRYLDLSGNDIQALPEAITSLFHLQTLNLEGCSKLEELPKGMKNLKNLRHLQLDRCYRLAFMPSGMGSLRNLQTLSQYMVDDASGSSSIRELKDLNIGGTLRLRSLDKVRDAMEAKEACLFSKEKLKVLALCWGGSGTEVVAENIVEVMEALQPPRSLEDLGICGYRGTHFANWLMNCPLHLSNLVSIVLSYCKNCEHLPQLGQLPFLRSLLLEEMDGVKYLGGSSGSSFYGSGINITGQGGRGDNSSSAGRKRVFPMLEDLHIINMANLEEWTRSDSEATRAVDFIPQLITLKIDGCPKLTTLPWIPSIENLYLQQCPLLVLEKGFFKNMTSLVIKDCDKQVSLPDWLERLTALDYLYIGKCLNLITLPQGLEGLSSLKILWIEGCPNLTSLPDGLWSLTELEFLWIEDCPKLTSLSDGLWRLTKLELLWIQDCPELTSLPDGLGRRLIALDTLVMCGCSNLIKLPQGLESLLRLFIAHCPKLTSLPVSLLEGLTVLKIENCPNLERQFGAGEEHQHLVSHIQERCIGEKFWEAFVQQVKLIQEV